MSIHFSIPSLSSRYSSVPPKLAGSTILSAPSSGSSPTVGVSLLPLAPLRRPSSTPYPGRSCKADPASRLSVKASSQQSAGELRTCRNCKKPFDSSQNHPRACRFHTAHFGGETKRKFESVYSGGTMDTVGGGEIIQYWHCCGSEDPFDIGCEVAPHSTYDD